MIYIINYHQFLFFRGGLGCSFWPSRFFKASLIEIGTGSIAALMTSGPIMLLGLKLFGLIILLIDLIGSRKLLVLFCLYLSPLFL